MNDIQMAKLLGLLGLGLGTLQLVASRRIAARLGVGRAGLVKLVGGREIVTGLMVLNKPDTALPLWGRVVGDALDVAVLAAGLGSGNRRRGGTAAALAVVLATTALDVAVAGALDRREQNGLQTARRTRVPRAAAEPAIKRLH